MGKWQSSGDTERPSQATGMRGWACWGGGCSLILKSQKLLWEQLFHHQNTPPPAKTQALGALGKQKCPCPSHHRDAVLCSQVSHPHQGCLVRGLGVPKGKPAVSQNCRYAMETEMPQTHWTEESNGLAVCGTEDSSVPVAPSVSTIPATGHTTS